MTVETTKASDVYTGDGVQTAFVGNFPVLDEADILVRLDGVLVPDTEFTVAGDVSQPGWTVTFNTAPALGVEVLIRRETPAVQSTEYTPFGTYKAEQHEADFDKAMLIAQEFLDRIDRAVPEGSGTIDIGNRRLINVASSIDGSDAATRDDAQQIALDTLGETEGTRLLGPWDASGGTLPPTPDRTGDFYIIVTGGTLSLIDPTTGTPTPVAVQVNDWIMWLVPTSGLPTGWYLIDNSAQAGVLASAVIYDGTSSGLPSTNVQDAIDLCVTLIAERPKAADDETVTGNWSFDGDPAGTDTTGIKVRHADGTSYPAGLADAPPIALAVDTALGPEHAGKMLVVTADGVDLTIDPAVTGVGKVFTIVCAAATPNTCTVQGVNGLVLSAPGGDSGPSFRFALATGQVAVSVYTATSGFITGNAELTP